MNLRIRELAKDDRPRERLSAKGSEALRTSELIAILIGTGIPGRSALTLAEEMLATFGSLEKLARCSVTELRQIKGIGHAKAVQLCAAFALGSRFSREQAISHPLDSPGQILNFLGDLMRSLPHESLRVLSLNTRYHLINLDEVSFGTVNETVAHPRDILRLPLLHRASAFVLVHNHPSGNPSPSSADLDFTHRIRDAAKLMQITFLDHLIIGSPGNQNSLGYYSFREAGYL